MVRIGIEHPEGISEQSSDAQRTASCDRDCKCSELPFLSPEVET